MSRIPPRPVSSLAAARGSVGARWSLLIVERLLEGPQQYSDLQRDLGVPTNMLATRLRELGSGGVLSRLPLRHNTGPMPSPNAGWPARRDPRTPAVGGDGPVGRKRTAGARQPCAVRQGEWPELSEWRCRG